MTQTSLAKYVVESCTTAAPSVFAIALNSREQLARLADKFQQAPYKAAPKTPVIFLQPPSTLNRNGANVVLPAEQTQLRVEPHIGVVFADTTSRVTEQQAHQHIRGFVPVNLFSLPSDDYYRPDITGRCRDGFCVIGQEVQKSAVADPESIAIQVNVDGQLKKTSEGNKMLRSISELISFLSQFMTFKCGDILLVGTDDCPIIVTKNSHIETTFEQLGCVANTVVESAK
ncbi:fumarylacetoacetate hydrolase family protein [Gallibacterium melopsittaci]|uniref:Fumarylacetoacetate hydrolase family protein n=1 Tax=Gallibacterium melopsittaci TaxID=516063 RepID=A0ABV6HU77_9PAST